MAYKDKKKRIAYEKDYYKNPKNKKRRMKYMRKYQREYQRKRNAELKMLRKKFAEEK